MSVFCVTREKFLDRVIGADELEQLADLIRHWYLLRAGGQGADGRVTADALIYAFPRPRAGQIEQELTGRSPGLSCSAPGLDELCLTGPATRADAAADLSAWRAALADPQLPACLRLRLTIDGPLTGANGTRSTTVSTFVLCGAPAEPGSLLLKSIWRLGADHSMQLVFKAAPWDLERPLLKSLDTFAGQCRIGPPESAASLALYQLGKGSRDLFVARGEERLAMHLMRHWAELPDDHGPAAFARRVVVPLGAGACTAVAMLLSGASPATRFVSAALTAYFAFALGRIVWKKSTFVYQYYVRMRRGLGKLYSGPVEAVAADHSQDPTATVRKTSAELEALGARHLCDLEVTGASGRVGDQWIYVTGDAVISWGLLRTAGQFQLFPPEPLFSVCTRFTDGRRHFTLNKPVYRRPARADTTARCLAREGGAEEVMALHRRHVDRLIAGGAVPVTPPATTADVIAQVRSDHEVARENWRRMPYAWGDALHDAFKVCRREYLAD